MRLPRNEHTQPGTFSIGITANWCIKDELSPGLANTHIRKALDAAKLWALLLLMLFVIFDKVVWIFGTV